MFERRTLLVALGAALTALPAGAAEPESECQVVRHVWELELVEVAAEVDRPGLDLNAVGSALGTRARIGGGIIDPAERDDPIRLELLGSDDGVGLRIGAERVP